MAKRKANGLRITAQLQGLQAELDELRAIRAKHEKLIAEVEELRAVRAEHEELLAVLEGFGQSRGPRRRKSGAGSSRKTSGNGKRKRSSPDELDSQYKTLKGALTSQWQTRSEWLASAGLGSVSSICIKRLTDGYSDGDDKIAPAAETNGKRGRGARLRKVKA